MCTARVQASHIVGGEIYYECIGNNNYLVTLKVYRDCYNGQAPFDNPANIFIYNGGGSLVDVLSVPFPGSDTLPNDANNPCLIVPPNICVEEAVYTYNVNLPANGSGYTLIYQRCCRNITIVNIPDPSNTGATYEATMPDSNVVICNSSPYFNNFPPTVICVDFPFSFDHSATDPDGDSLVYELCSPYYGANSIDPQPYPPYAYGNLTFSSPYSASDPMGGSPPMAIDPETGWLTVTPNAIGQFVVGVCVTEYRNGEMISIHRRDFQFNVAECGSAAVASVPAVLNGCDGFSFSFPNYSTNAITFLWDFGVPGTTTDTSTLFSPTYVYSDTGIYTVTLYANPGTSCADTATTQVYVFPTFTGSIQAPDGCAGLPVQFTDSTTTTYGVINNWDWNFAGQGTSNEQNPQFTFTDPGNYQVTLEVTNTLGCSDSVTTTVVVNPQPVAFAAPDTLICYLDSVQLTGTGAGSYQWAPDYALSNDTISNPWAGPDQTTQYILRVQNQWGCYDEDTIEISVFDSIEAIGTADTVICPGDQVQLNVSGGSYFLWTPAAGLSDPYIGNPVASPVSSTLYTVITGAGSCTDTLEIYVGVKPFPLIAAGPDQQICIGDSVQIDAAGGTWYHWSPEPSLTDPNIANPVAFPSSTTQYYLQSTDSNSCPVLIFDSLTVFVIVPEPLTITPDTLIYLGTSAQLYAYGAAFYDWNPKETLSDSYVENPTATPLITTEYLVDAVTEDGCKLTGSVTVTVEEDPLVIFPNAFTPNGDGMNDEFYPLVFGLFETEVFSVFNRWGQLVYTTSDLQQGWDGQHGGKKSEVGTYVYYLRGNSATTGKEYFLKGNVVLLR
jgi:gliding motility-associated-like protein